MGASIIPRRALSRPHTEREVLALHLARRERRGELLVRASRSRHEHEPARVAVESVHDARARRITDHRELGVPGEEPVHEGAVLVPRPGVDHEPCGFREHDEIRVFEADVEHDARVSHRWRGNRRRRQELDLLARGEPATLRRLPSVDEHRVRVDQPLDLAARPPRQQRHRAVESLAREALRDVQRVRHGGGSLGPARPNGWD